MDIPSEATEALLAVRKHLNRSLIAAYLHGSAVAGGLRPYSDVDLLIVTELAIAPEARKALLHDLLRLSGPYPFDAGARRPLEVVLFSRSHLSDLPYPARSEFIYGEWLRQDFEAGAGPDLHPDPEMTLLLAQARQEARPLYGPEAARLLPAIPPSHVRQAIKDALPALLAGLIGDERNVLLTLARMWRTLLTGDFVPKDVAATWAAARLPKAEADLLLAARQAYLDGRDVDWKAREQQLQRTLSALHDRILEKA